LPSDLTCIAEQFIKPIYARQFRLSFHGLYIFHFPDDTCCVDGESTGELAEEMGVRLYTGYFHPYRCDWSCVYRHTHHHRTGADRLLLTACQWTGDDAEPERSDVRCGHQWVLSAAGRLRTALGHHSWICE